jgi:prephenate dehydratase
LLPCTTIPAIARAIRSGEADQGVAPVENSLQGSITDTLDVLIHSEGVHVFSELVLTVVHNLVARPGTAVAQIQAVYSHPQALGQCQTYLERHLPNAELRASLSTAAAVEEMLKSAAAAAAIAPLRAAQLYGATILAQGIQDNPNNATRFLVLATHDHPRTGQDKTSICFSFADDRPGLLYSVMREMAERKINLSKVESRPTREGLGQYYFLLDLEGHKEDPGVREALDKVAQATSLLKIFGSYPRFVAP